MKKIALMILLLVLASGLVGCPGGITTAVTLAPIDHYGSR